MTTRPTLTVAKKDYAWTRDRFPDWDVRARPTGSWLDILLVWLGVFGVWPFIDPGHDFDTAWSAIDVLLHCAAIGCLAGRWRVVRR